MLGFIAIECFLACPAPNYGNSIFGAGRKRAVLIQDKKHGKFLIRDNGPLPLNKLQASLIDMTPEQFYKELNKKVFFWPTEQRVKGLLGARRYRNRKHTVIKVRSDLLLKHYQTKIHLSRINSGSAL